jgi:pimeloyl-ACP methyl ester carboxylesterase
MLLSLGIFFLSEHLLLFEKPAFGQMERPKVQGRRKITGTPAPNRNFHDPTFSTKNPRPELRGMPSPFPAHQTLQWNHDGWTWSGLWLGAEKETKRVVVAFHGFGRPLEEMANYLPLYGSGTSMLSVGLCHHNGSKPPSGTVDAPELGVFTMRAAVEAGLQSCLPNELLAVPRHLLGYSLGGRIALALFESHPTSWAGMVVLAPDGFKKNPMYRFAVETRVGRAAWKWSDRHSDAVRASIRFLRQVRLLPAHLEHFALHHTESPEMRALVARTWKTHRAFWPSLEGTAQAWASLPERNVHVVAVFGNRDAIIPWAWSRSWRKLASSHVGFVQVECGHVMRHPQTVLAIGNAILALRDEQR